MSVLFIVFSIHRVLYMFIWVEFQKMEKLEIYKQFLICREIFEYTYVHAVL